MIDKIIEDLGANYREADEDILQDIINDVTSIASNISNRSKTDEKLYPYIKTAVKSIYLARGGEGIGSITESGKSLSFIDSIEKMRNDIIKAGLRKCF